MATSQILELNTAMRGLSALRRFEFLANEDCSRYDLLLHLSESDFSGSREAHIKFLGVSQLAVKKFGGGLTQLVLLKAKDIRSLGWDRANYQIDELERDYLSFTCESFRVL